MIHADFSPPPSMLRLPRLVRSLRTLNACAVQQAFGTGSDDSSCRLFDMRCYGEANYFGNDKVRVCVCVISVVCSLVVCWRRTGPCGCFPLAPITCFLTLFRPVIFRETSCGRGMRMGPPARPPALFCLGRLLLLPSWCWWAVLASANAVLTVAAIAVAAGVTLRCVALDPVRHHVGRVLAEWSALVCGLRRLQLLRVGRYQQHRHPGLPARRARGVSALFVSVLFASGSGLTW